MLQDKGGGELGRLHSTSWGAQLSSAQSQSCQRDVRGDSHGMGTVSSHSSPSLPTMTQGDMEPGLPLLVTGAEL